MDDRKCCWILVQARSIEKAEDGTETAMSKESKDQFYLKLLAYLQNHDVNDDDDDDSSSSSDNDDDEDEDDPSSASDEVPQPSPKRAFFLFPNRRSSQQRLRPMHSYGRKAHWDTFFG